MANPSFVLDASIDDIICQGMRSADDVLHSEQIVNPDITVMCKGVVAVRPGEWPVHTRDGRLSRSANLPSPSPAAVRRC